MAQIYVESKTATDFFTMIAKRAANPIEATKLISTMMHRDVLRHFGAIEGPEGEQWKPLKENTWKYKIKHGYYNILQNTGMLRRRNIPHNTSKSAIVTNDMAYAGTHQYGNPEKNVPARPFLWLSSNALEEIIRYMAKYLVRKGAV